MRNLTDSEKMEMVVKVAQKWLEKVVGNTSDLDKIILEVAFLKATEFSNAIIQELYFEQREESDLIKAWVEIGIFAGFITGWKSGNSLPRGVAADLNRSMKQANSVAYHIADVVFEQLVAEPKSPLISALHESQLAFLKSALERSLFTGHLEGIAHAEDMKNSTLSSFNFDPLIEV